MKAVWTCLLLLVAAAAFSADGIALSIPDAAVLDQNGRQLHFRSDLIDGRLVVVNFIFTSCTTVCSPMGANFAALQDRLGSRTDVRLVSVDLTVQLEQLAFFVQTHAGPLEFGERGVSTPR